MTTYQLTIHAIGGTATRRITAEPDQLAQAVHRHVRGLLGSSRVTITLDPGTLTGTITNHGAHAGRFALAVDSPATAPKPHDPMHGYTSADIDYLTRGVLILDRWSNRAADIEERADAVRYAIVEHLLTAKEPPTRGDLIGAGLTASTTHTAGQLHHYGYDSRRPAAGAGAMRGYQRYWTPNHDSAEDRIVELIALDQILARLTPRQQRLLKVLADCSTHQQAAAASGYTPQSYKVLLSAAQRAFTSLWHEHETPPRRRLDRRVHSADNTWHGRSRLTASEVEALKERRRDSNVTVAELAAEVGMSRPALSALLTGRTRPAPDPVGQAA